MVGSAILTMELSSADISTPIRMAAAAKYRRGMSKPSSSAGRVRWLRRRSACGVGVEEGVGSCRARRQRLGKRRDRAFGVAGLRRTFRSQVAAGASAQKRLSIGACGAGRSMPLIPEGPRRAGRRAWAQEIGPGIVQGRCRGAADARRVLFASRLRQHAAGFLGDALGAVPPTLAGRDRAFQRQHLVHVLADAGVGLAARPTSGRPVAAALFAVAYGVGHDFMGVAEGQAALDR